MAVGTLRPDVLDPNTSNADAMAAQVTKASKRAAGRIDLRTVVSGQLNPTWVEWLMGWPSDGGPP